MRCFHEIELDYRMEDSSIACDGSHMFAVIFGRCIHCGTEFHVEDLQEIINKAFEAPEIEKD